MCLNLCLSHNLHVLIVADYFLKWTEAFPMRDQEATTIAEIFVWEVISYFGLPLSLHSDQGWNFESTVFSEMCRFLGVKKIHITPLHPQSDAMMERLTELSKHNSPNLLININEIGMSTYPQLLMIRLEWLQPRKWWAETSDYQLIFSLDSHLKKCLCTSLNMPDSCTAAWRIYTWEHMQSSKEWQDERVLQLVCSCSTTLSARRVCLLS